MKSILIVEDDRVVSLALATLLRANGFRVTQAFDGLMAVIQVSKETPDLVILDIMLPGGGGLSVAERLRGLAEIGRIPIVPIVVASGVTDGPTRAKIAALRPAGLVEKPYDPAAVLDIARRILGGAPVAPPP